MEPIFVRPVEAASLLSVSRSRIYEMLNAGTIPAVRLGGTAWRIPRAAIEKLARDAMNQTAENQS
jgi:excisionase family DNA binding protein